MADFKWCILGTGYVAQKFARGLAVIPAMSAAFASRDRARAEAVANSVGATGAFGSFEDALADDTVKAVYVATPSNLHKEHAIAALSAGKPVLVEKPFALNGAEGREIVAAARANNVFCMEALWTRFLPSIRHLKSLVDAGEIGEPQSLIASFGLAEAPGGDNPLFDPARGGGALLDRGVYLLSLAQHVLGAPSSITAKARTSVTGVDEHTALTLTYPNGAIASLIASLTADLPNRFLISGTAGAIELDAPIFRPSRLTLSQTEPRTYAAGAAAGGKAAALKESPLVHQLHQRLAPALKLKPQTGTSRLLKAYQGNGYHHQAAEVMRAVAASELESPIMPLEESLAVLDAVDAARQSD